MNNLKNTIDSQKTKTVPLPTGFTSASVIIILIAVTVFIFLALNAAYHGPLVDEDQAVSQAFHAQAVKAPDWVVSLMNFGFFLGQGAIMGAAGLLGLYWLVTRDWRKFTLLALGVGGGSVWFIILANLVNRPRPSFPDPLRPVIAYPGFPSGHVISSVLMYGLLFYLLSPGLKTRWQRLLVGLVAVGIVLFIAFSRVYIGDHYLTDVLAGLMVGVAWGTFIRLVVERYYRKQNLPA